MSLTSDVAGGAVVAGDTEVTLRTSGDISDCAATGSREDACCLGELGATGRQSNDVVNPE